MDQYDQDDIEIIYKYITEKLLTDKDFCNQLYGSIGQILCFSCDMLNPVGQERCSNCNVLNVANRWTCTACTYAGNLDELVACSCCNTPRQ
jgi:hypothetical protein